MEWTNLLLWFTASATSSGLAAGPARCGFWARLSPTEQIYWSHQRDQRCSRRLPLPQRVHTSRKLDRCIRIDELDTNVDHSVKHEMKLFTRENLGSWGRLRVFAYRRLLPLLYLNLGVRVRMIKMVLAIQVL